MSQSLKGAVCELDGGRLVIKVDSEFKANILKDSILVIKKHAEKFTGGACEVSVELPVKADGGDNISIDDIDV